MKNIQLEAEEIEQMNYNDVAYVILEASNKKMKIIDLLNEVGRLMQKDEAEIQEHITDFFELLSTDKRFIMLDDGYWDLRVKHNKGMQLDSEDEDEDIILEDEETTDEDEEEYDETKAEDDDVEDDDLSDLVIIDDVDEETGL